VVAPDFDRWEKIFSLALGGLVMRKFALVAAAAVMAAAGSAVNADFVITTTRTTVNDGSAFNGDDLVSLLITQNAGTAQTGFLISGTVAESSTAANPQFFIRTMTTTKRYDAVTLTNDHVADFAGEGVFRGTTGFTPRNTSGLPEVDGSYVNPGGVGGPITVLGSTVPSETATNYADLQSVAGFSVQAGYNGTTGVDVSTTTQLAQAVVPAGQAVTFSGTVSSFGGTASNLAFTTAVPEPTSLALVGIAAAGLFSRRRRIA